MFPSEWELSQEFRLYHNLYHDRRNSRFLVIDADGQQSEAVRYGDDNYLIRSDLILRFCAVKQMALAIYFDGFRHSEKPLKTFAPHEVRALDEGSFHAFHYAVVHHPGMDRRSFKTMGRLLACKYILPGPFPKDSESVEEEHQKFIIESAADGTPVRHTCDPSKLADYFGMNQGEPHFLTPVFFRAEVLDKYYADPGLFEVEDGRLQCQGLWSLRLDNDHWDYVVVWLGDLGQDLSERERHHWLSFNIPPDGRKISETCFRRAICAQFWDPSRPDFLFKAEFRRFRSEFREHHGWDFFLDLHADDEHFLVALRLPSKDRQAEFDGQLLGLTKIIVDSLNEKQIAAGLSDLAPDEKGITKLEKFFKGRGLQGFERHIKFLRVLQELRSKSAAHRKGSSYEKLIANLQIPDEGLQRVFGALLSASVEFIRFLRSSLLPTGSE